MSERTDLADLAQKGGLGTATMIITNVVQPLLGLPHLAVALGISLGLGGVYTERAPSIRRTLAAWIASGALIFQSAIAVNTVARHGEVQVQRALAAPAAHAEPMQSEPEPTPEPRIPGW